MDIPNPLSHSPLYPMLISTLMMQNFTPHTQSSFAQEYDYIIVGAGTAGSTLAGRLSEDPSVSVLLLEAGLSPPPIIEVPAVARSFVGSYIDWNVQTVPQKNFENRRTNLTLGKTVGGTSILNSMLNIRGNKEDYDDWANSGADGWDYKSVLYYFRKLESYQVPKYYNTIYHGWNGPVTIELPTYEESLKNIVHQTAIENGYQFVDPNAEFQNGFFEITGNIRKGRRCSTAKAYLLDQRRNLDVIANAFVTRIIIDNRRAAGVELEFQRRSHNVRARREVIVSAGAILTPKLLMLSGIGPIEHLEEKKIHVVADLPVGKNFHDQILISQSYSLFSDKPASYSLLTDSQIERYIKHGNGILSSNAGAFTGVFIPSSDDSPPTFEAYFLYGNTSDYSKSSVSCIIQSLRPKSRGTIKLRSIDPHDQPLIDPNCFDNEEDAQVVVEGMKFCNHFMSSKRLKDIGARRIPHFHKFCDQYQDENKYLRCILTKSGHASNHPVGSVKMGSVSDPTTVLDPQLSVKGIRCLRVVDGSVMPKTVSGNPNIPIIMIAEKAADMIKSSRKCR